MTDKNDKNTAFSQDVNEKRLRAYQLRKEGHAVVSIAVELGVSAPTVYRYINEGREAYYDLFPEERQYAKNLELSRLDDMTIKVFEKAKEGDCRSINAMLKIMERRARLLGLNEPARQEIETKTEMKSIRQMTDEELLEIIRKDQQCNTPLID